MLNQAKAKLHTEIDKNKGSFIKVVGSYLLQYLEDHPGAAEKILAEDKTIKGSLAEMRAVAEKQKDGNVAVLTYEEGFAVVLKYFEINGTTESAAPVEKSNADFDVRLEDLL